MKFPVDRKKLLIPAALALAVLAAWYAVAGMVPHRAKGLLARHGFTDVQTGAPSFHGDSFALSDIKLDPGAFSTIRALRVQPDWTGLFGGRFIGGLIIDDMRLMGEWKDGKGLSIVGWEPRLPPYPQQDSIIINGLRLDLDTHYGALRFETKGRLTHTKDGGYKLDGVLYSKQHQLIMDTRWTGAVSPNGAFGLEGEIQPGGAIRTEHLEATRISGWMQVASELAKNSNKIIPVISGQLQAGRISFNDIPLSNAEITVEGPLAGPHMIITADVSGLAGMRVNADLTPDGATWQVKAEVATPELKDMLAFMAMLRQNMEAHDNNSLTSFLLTSGNIERLRKKVSAMKYDELELKIEGPMNKLHGSLIAKRQDGKGETKRTAISLDPASR